MVKMNGENIWRHPVSMQANSFFEFELVAKKVGTAKIKQRVSVLTECIQEVG